MHIIINNCSSPGASFTDNTNKVILSCYEWVTEHSGEVKPFIDFRREVSKAKNFNDNNARNIYPLLQNVGFVSYGKGSNLEYDHFFTRTGKAYAKMVETEKLIFESDYSEKNKKDALKQMQQAKETLIYQGLLKLLSKESNYRKEMAECLKFLTEFKKINKTEFAYLLYSISECLDNAIVKKDIELYRTGDLIIDVTVSVRNDIDLREKTGDKKRKEGLSFLTAYSYFCGLFEQAGLIIKSEAGYFAIAMGSEEKIKKLLEVAK